MWADQLVRWSCPIKLRLWRITICLQPICDVCRRNQRSLHRRLLCISEFPELIACAAATHAVFICTPEITHECNARDSTYDANFRCMCLFPCNATEAVQRRRDECTTKSDYDFIHNNLMHWLWLVLVNWEGWWVPGIWWQLWYTFFYLFCGSWSLKCWRWSQKTTFGKFVSNKLYCDF